MGVTTAITVVLNRGDDDAGAGAAPTAGGASTTAGPVATTAGPAELALAALPRSAQPLPDDVVVVGQVVDGRAVLVEVDATTGESVQITSGTDDAVSPSSRRTGAASPSPASLRAAWRASSSCRSGADRWPRCCRPSRTAAPIRGARPGTRPTPPSWHSRAPTRPGRPPSSS
ncbi:hypothetical protein ACFQX8_15960 [Klenkia terrae]|uniref:hypothetical protein n=1 Tax=Klenkia terrae TaxID=1052259 RepID=UPI003622113A